MLLVSETLELEVLEVLVWETEELEVEELVWETEDEDVDNGQVTDSCL